MPADAIQSGRRKAVMGMPTRRPIACALAALCSAMALLAGCAGSTSGAATHTPAPRATATPSVALSPDLANVTLYVTTHLGGSSRALYALAAAAPAQTLSLR